MTVQQQIDRYISTQPERKREEMQNLHEMILASMQACRVWFLNGRDEKGTIVANPSIGYGSRTIRYSNGTSKEFYQVGISANTTGISVYIIGIEDKKYLSETFGRDLGKASVTGYCIRFKTLADIDLSVLEAAIRYGVGQKSNRD